MYAKNIFHIFWQKKKYLCFLKNSRSPTNRPIDNVKVLFTFSRKINYYNSNTLVIHYFYFFCRALLWPVLNFILQLVRPNVSFKHFGIEQFGKDIQTLQPKLPCKTTFNVYLRSVSLLRNYNSFELNSLDILSKPIRSNMKLRFTVHIFIG